MPADGVDRKQGTIMKRMLCEVAPAIVGTGCQTTGHKITKIDVGEGRDQVVPMLGRGMSLQRQCWLRALSAVGLLAMSMWVGAMEDAPTTPFDKALIARAVPDDGHEADIVVATLRERNRPQMADALDTWLIRRRLERVLGRAVTASSVDEAIHSPFAQIAPLNRVAMTEFEASFPIDFLETTAPVEVSAPVASAASRLAPGVLQWNWQAVDGTPRRFDASVRIGNSMTYPVTLQPAWVLENALFACDSVDVPAHHSAVVTCSTRSPIVSGERIAHGLIALKAGQEQAEVVDLKVTIPSLDFRLRVALSGVAAFDDSDDAVAYDNRAEARRRIAAAPCESTGDCDRRVSAAETHANPYTRLAIVALAFTAFLGFRFRRGSTPYRWLMIPWTFYSLAGVAAIIIATVDPPQPGLGDGMIHGLVGQLSLFVLALPWSWMIVTTPGAEPSLNPLMLAVLMNIVFGATLVFVGDRPGRKRPSW